MPDRPHRPPPREDDDELLACLADVLAPPPAEPAHAEMAPMFQALEERRHRTPAAAIGVRRGLRWALLAGTAVAAVAVVVAIAPRPDHHRSRLSAASPTSRPAPETPVVSAGQALAALERALQQGDRQMIATAASGARDALSRLRPDERAAFEPRATTLLDAAASSGIAPGPQPGAAEPTLTPPPTVAPTTAAPPARSTTVPTTAGPTSTTSTAVDHPDDGAESTTTPDDHPDSAGATGSGQ